MTEAADVCPLCGLEVQPRDERMVVDGRAIHTECAVREDHDVEDPALAHARTLRIAAMIRRFGQR